MCVRRERVTKQEGMILERVMFSSNELWENGGARMGGVAWMGCVVGSGMRNEGGGRSEDAGREGRNQAG